jgi:hypothetical protein
VIVSLQRHLGSTLPHPNTGRKYSKSKFKWGRNFEAMAAAPRTPRATVAPVKAVASADDMSRTLRKDLANISSGDCLARIIRFGVLPFLWLPPWLTRLGRIAAGASRLRKIAVTCREMANAALPALQRPSRRPESGPREPPSGHHGLVQLTEHELTAASSAVAALAIIGGYLGVRSANRNAVHIAREERSSRRGDELTALKRVVYARCMAAINELSAAAVEEAKLRNKMRSVDIPADGLKDGYESVRKAKQNSAITATNIIAELDLLAPVALQRLTHGAFQAAFDHGRADESGALVIVGDLLSAMRDDIDSQHLPVSASSDPDH